MKNFNIELLRTLSVLFMILIHMSMSYFHSNLIHDNLPFWFLNNLYYSFSRFCVPIFFIIAAYLCFNNISSTAWYSKAMRLLLPLIFWSFIYYFYSGGRDLFELLFKIFFQNASFHLWFIPAFLGYVILLPAIKAMLSGDSLKNSKHIFLFVFFFSIVLPSIIEILSHFYDGYGFLKSLNKYGMTIPAFLVYAFAFPYLHERIKPFKGIVFYFSIVILNSIFCLLLSLKLDKANEYLYGFTTPLVFISSFIFFNSIMSMDFTRLSPFITKLVYKIGECSFGIYLIHWIVYLVLDTNKLVLKGSPAIGPLVNTILVFIISFFLVYIIRLVKPLRRIC